MSQLINAQTLQNLLADDKTLVLDCRADLSDPTKSLQQYNNGHIPGALFAHLEEDLSAEIIAGKTGRHPLPLAKTLQQTLRRWGIQKSSRLVVYDQSNSMFAVRAWWLLKWAGVSQVQVLNGGLNAWLAAGGEITTDASADPQPSSFTIEANSDWLVTAEDLTALPATTRLLDARALPRYRGDEEPLDSKAGHIPGAVNADFSKNLNDDGSFKSAEILRERFQTTANHPTICYCGSGVTACHNILAIVEAGYPMPKLYPGSWSEWITQDSRPIATGSEGEI